MDLRTTKKTYVKKKGSNFDDSMDVRGTQRAGVSRSDLAAVLSAIGSLRGKEGKVLNAEITGERRVR